MRIAVFCSLGLLLSAFLFVWLVTRVRYRIGSKHVKVLLFGLCIRRVALSSIESVSKRRGEGWAEHWWSTMKPKHRLLVIRRKRGLCRNFVITPKNRYIFKTDLERAMRRVGVSLSLVEAETLEGDTEVGQENKNLASESSSAEIK